MSSHIASFPSRRKNGLYTGSMARYSRWVVNLRRPSVKAGGGGSAGGRSGMTYSYVGFVGQRKDYIMKWSSQGLFLLKGTPRRVEGRKVQRPNGHEQESNRPPPAGLRMHKPPPRKPPNWFLHWWVTREVGPLSRTSKMPSIQLYYSKPADARPRRD